jgi:1,4-dihydroxy-2-naphthoate polyprenyltransferase
MTEVANDSSRPVSAPRSEFRAPRSFWRAARGFSLPVSVLPVGVVTAAVLPVSAWRWDVLVACALGVGLLHVAANMLNDYFDFRSGVDRHLEGNETRPGLVLVRGGLAPRDILWEAAACLVLGAATAAYVVWRSGPEVLGFAGPALVALYVYTGPPLALKYRALGEPVIFIVFGPLLLLGAAWAQVQRFDLTALLLSVPVGLATTAVLVGNNFRDRREDAEAGIRTIGHLAGGRVVRITYVACVAGAAAGLAAMVAAGAGPLGLALAPVTLLLLIEPLKGVARNERLPDIDARTARWEAVLLVLVLASYLVQPPA